MRIYETLFKSRSITRKIDTVIVHCAAVGITSHVTTEDIARWHIQERHFRDIGYHFIVDKLGIIHLGRPLNEIGAHCKGHNAHSIGICYIGGLDAQGNPADTRTPLQQLAIKQLIGLLVNEFKIYDVYGHRDLSPDVNGDGQITSVDWVKMCPCYDAHAEWLQYLKEMAIVARNYGAARMGQTQADDCSLATQEDIALMNLCEAAEDYLDVVVEASSTSSSTTESSSETSSSYLDDAENYAGESPYDEDSFESLTLLEDPPPDELLKGCEVPPSHQSCAPASEKAPEARLYLGAWKGMNWRGWGRTRGRMRGN